MTYGRKKRGLVDRDISKIGFRVEVGFERRVELSEVERRNGKLPR